MKFLVAIAVVLALLALTQAENQSSQVDQSESEVASSDELNEDEQSDQENPEIPAADESEPPQPDKSEEPPKAEGADRPPRKDRPERPGRRHLEFHFSRPQPEEHQADDGSSDNSPPQRHLPRRPVFFDFGRENEIYGNEE